MNETGSDVLFSVRGRIGFILLNRPRALNALTGEMCVAVREQLAAWAGDEQVAAVVIEGEGERAFCAGGDVLKVANSAREGGTAWRDFFHEEYRMNSAIGHFPKPFVAILDGIAMGGGVGISIHGPWRIATERTLLAMPETGLGLIPDVGGSYVLPRLPGAAGMYLALTGARVEAADCVHLGLATHYIPVEKLITLKTQLAEGATPLTQAEVGAMLDEAAVDPGEPPIALRQPQIDRHFGLDSVGAIIDSLKGDSTRWAYQTRAGLLGKSPVSLALSFAAQRRGAALSLDDCLRMEYRVVNRIMSMDRDFFEGVRALLVDKDKAPKWQPARLADLDPAAIEAHFAELGADELQLP